MLSGHCVAAHSCSLQCLQDSCNVGDVQDRYGLIQKEVIDPRAEEAHYMSKHAEDLFTK